MIGETNAQINGVNRTNLLVGYFNNDQRLSGAWTETGLDITVIPGYDTSIFSPSTTSIRVLKAGVCVISARVSVQGSATNGSESLLLNVVRLNSSLVEKDRINNRSAADRYEDGCTNTAIMPFDAGDYIWFAMNGSSTNFKTCFAPAECSIRVLYLGNEL